LIEEIIKIFAQTKSSQEIQFLAYLSAVVIGIQLSFYFFYQYYKIQDVYLRLNRILLSYGSFTLLIVSGALFLNISRIFVADPMANAILNKIGWVCALFSPIGFLYFIVLKEFSKIMNLKIVKILMILSLIPIFVVIIVPSTSSPLFIASLSFTLLGAYYLFSFQIRLIKQSVGTIKIKFIQFFFGELISLSSLFFAVQVGLGILPPGITELVYFIGVGILLTGFIIMFFSAYEFPPFYEFEWKENLLKLFIINQKDNNCLYYCNLSEAVKQKISTDKIESLPSLSYGDRLFSGGIAGIEDIISAITDTKGEKINKIRQEDSIILLEYGTTPSNITYAMLVEKDLASHQHLLKLLKRQFEIYYKEVLLNLDNFKENQEQLFRSFDLIINDILED